MRRSISKTKNRRGPKFGIDRVFSIKSGKPVKTRLGKSVQQCLDRWKEFDSGFFEHVNEHCFALKIRSLGLDEQFVLRLLIERQKVALIGVSSWDNQLNKERGIGYIVLKEGDPIVHLYTFYVTLAYSDITQIGSKSPELLYQDRYLSMLKFGIGSVDYMFGYRKKRKTSHDLENTSSGSVHAEVVDAWKDGT